MLLPVEDLRPEHVCRDEWEQLFQESHGVENVPPCVLQPQFSQQVMQSLVVAADLPLEELKRDCEFTMGCLRAAMGDWHREVGQAPAP